MNNMKLDNLKELIETGREIEFTYKNKRYSITYPDEHSSINDCISFCEFYKEPKNVFTYDELIEISVDEIKLKDIWISLDQATNEVDIF